MRTQLVAALLPGHNWYVERAPVERGFDVCLVHKDHLIWGFVPDSSLKEDRMSWLPGLLCKTMLERIEDHISAEKEASCQTFSA